MGEQLGKGEDRKDVSMSTLLTVHRISPKYIVPLKSVQSFRNCANYVMYIIFYLKLRKLSNVTVHLLLCFFPLVHVNNAVLPDKFADVFCDLLLKTLTVLSLTAT